MRKLFLAFLAIIAIVLLCAFLGYQLYLKPPSAPAKQVFINGHVFTMDGSNAIVEAIALEGDTIVAVGSNEVIKSYIEADTVVNDLAGKTLLPGFVDAHSHFPGVGVGDITVDLNSPPVGTVNNISDIQQRLTLASQDKDAGQWLIGMGYDDSLLAENRHVSRDELDKVSTTHPIVIIHVSGHFVVANTLALQISNIDDNTPNIDGGIYVKDDNGRLTGLLEETARLKTLELAFDLSPLEFLRMCQQGVKEYAAAGVTTAQAGLAAEMLIQGLTSFKKLGFIPQRLMLWPDMDTGERWAKGEFDADKYSSDGVTIGAVKLVSDGSIQGYTGYLGSPYHSHDHGHKADYKGYLTMPQAELNQRVLAIHKAGLQLAVHANGDAAIAAVIEAVRLAQQASPRDDTRHIVVHSQMATAAQLQQMKELGMSPSFFSAHTYYWGDRHRDIFIGPERAAKISPSHTAQQLGLPFSIHLDTPVVPMDPLFAVWSTVNRITSSGKLLGGDERIDVMQALRAVTIDAAWQMFVAGDRGSLEVGKKADLVIIDANPLQDPQAINTINVLQTFVGGVSIYNKEGAQ